VNARKLVVRLTAALAVVLACGIGLGGASAATVPTCNGFDAGGAPVYVDPATSAVVTPCTDYFGANNYANSPLPAGTVTGFTLLAGGSGYVNPQVVVADPTNPAGTCTATATQVAGVIFGFGAPTGSCANYTIPQVTIVDAGPCGAAPLPACGTGALATATLGAPFVGGIPKFVGTDLLPDLKGLLAVADTTTFPGSDYYEIVLVQYTQKMHSALPPTTLRGYAQVASGSANACAEVPIVGPSYLGPVIVAKKDRAVRVKFTNCLAAGAGGNLFIPADATYMGAGMGPDGTPYTENRATLHLHGGATPWISDGTPHQWTVPVGETASLQTGMSTAYVPDMYFLPTGEAVPQCSATVTTNCSDPTGANLPAGATNSPGQGSMTFYWTNQQGGRLMFYHDHAYGITRLNVYAGEAAGYLLADPVEEDALAAGGAPGTIGALVGGTSPNDLAHLIPLVIQDKTFVPSTEQLNIQDPTWAGNFGATPLVPLATSPYGNGDLWFPHVYMPNQNPADPGMGSAFGRWDYGAWFFPPQTSLTAANPPTAVTIPCTSAAFPGMLLAPTAACPTCGCPITPNPSGTPESFMDTPVLNGMAYPVLHVAPEAYRFKMLAAGNDRSWHLSLFVPDPAQGMTEVAMLPAFPPTFTTPLTPTTMPLCPQLNPLSVPSLEIGLATGLLDATGNPLNGTGLPANCWPNFGNTAGIPVQQTMWPADGRRGGVPDPRRAGPAWIQIGTEGGILPEPVVVPSQPVGYEANVRSITIGSVGSHGLWIGPAERADVIVDFSKALPICAALGVTPCTLIVYNDAPAPAPASDARLDYFTGDGDQTPIGGAPNTVPGYGPNTRTIMQIIVDGTPTGQAPFSLPALKTAFATTGAAQGVFSATQPQIIVPEAGYGTAYNATFPNTYMGISDNTLAFVPLSPLTFDQPPCVATPPMICGVLDQKAIQELFTLDYGRMNATMGTENPLTNFQTQTTVPLGYVDWPTELVQGGQTQLWKVTHNGVDTHFIHFHLFNVQVINRVGWDGSLRQPDPTELGWKETVRMNPLEDILVALQPITPVVPFPLPDSIRPMDVTMPVGVVSPSISGLDPNSGNATVTKVNQLVNFGWEYVWHCHILGHEENDMMRPIIHQVAPAAPTAFIAATPGPPVAGVALSWTDMSANESSFAVQRDTVATFNSPALATFFVNATSLNTSGFNTLGYGQNVTFIDQTALAGTAYLYRLQATDSFLPANPNPANFKAQPLSSAWVGPVTATGVALVPTVTFTGAPLAAFYGSTFVVTATTNSSSVPTIAGTPGVCTVGPVAGTAASATATVTMTSGSGICVLTATWAPDSFFLGTTATQSTAAVPAPLTITANGAIKAYGQTVTFLGTEFTTAGLLAGDTVTSVTLTSAGAAATAAVGSYPIVPSAAVGTGLANYAISYVNGTLTVNPAALTITANSGSKPYGLAMTFVGNEFLATGLLNADTVTSVTLTSTGAAGTAGVGTYPIVPSAAVGTGLTNYTIAYVNGTLTVNPVALTITANNWSKVYGQTVTFAGTEFVPVGLLNTDAVTSVTLSSAGTAVTAAIGTYPIVPSAAVGTGLGNYSIAYVNGTLTVGQATSVTTITSSLPNPSIVGQVVTVGFSAAPQLFSGTPTGSVTVTASTGETCTAALTAGAGGCNLTFRTGGARTLTATYPGDANFLASVSTPLTQTVSSLVLSTRSLLFGNQVLNTNSASQTVSLTNVGTGPMLINLPTMLGDFTINSNNCPKNANLSAGRSCSISVRFRPTAVGVRTGTLSVNDADPTSPQLVALTGTGVAPQAVLTPAALNFGPVKKGTKSTLPITLSNPGTATLSISSISIGGANPSQFSRSSTCGNSLAAGLSCTINVTFTPSGTVGRTLNATLNVTDNANGIANSRQSATLTGTVQ
jgi:FtsP/CotA-like multicopper oxidase with cupredoxin domain